MSYVYIKDIMSPGLIFIDVESSLGDAWAKLESNKIHHLLALDSGVFVGVISDRDILLHFTPALNTKHEKNEDRQILSKKVLHIVHRHYISAEPEMLIVDAVKLMKEKNISCLPVIKDGKIIGIMTWRDLAKCI